MVAVGFQFGFITSLKTPLCVTNRGVVSREMWIWYYNLFNDKILQFRNISIQLLNEAGDRIAMEMQLYRAFPVQWDGPTLAASSSGIALEKIVFAHHGLDWKE
jgi:phage tail-like protein